MKIYLIALISGFFTFSAAASFAQANYYMVYDAKGQVTGKNEYVDIQGSPYLGNEWQNGSFTLENGKNYKDMSIRYDQVKDRMYVKGKNNDEMIALMDQVRDFTISSIIDGATIERHFKTGYTNIPGTTNTQYFEVLTDGKTQFLKRSTKKIQENKEYNSATSTKSFEEIMKYYLYADGKGTVVKKDKKSILAALGKKQAELEAYIKEEKLNLKSDADIAKLIKHYNSL